MRVKKLPGEYLEFDSRVELLTTTPNLAAREGLYPPSMYKIPEATNLTRMAPNTEEQTFIEHLLHARHRAMYQAKQTNYTKGSLERGK